MTAVHILLLAGCAVLALFLSWRRWPDYLIDSGRELYIPWRITEGAVLYRDVDDFYGPLSQYLNAALFRVFGVGQMTLVWANLVVFGGIVALMYGLVRRAWGAWPAVAAVGMFILVFGFSRFSWNGGLNYAFPYAHETTHGMLVVLALASVAVRWLASPSTRLAAMAGLLCGLTALLKPEFMLAAGVLTGWMVATHVRAGRTWRAGWAGAWISAALGPTVVFTLFFWRHGSLSEAFNAAGRGWLNVLATAEYVREPAQARYAGFDHPMLNLGQSLLAAGIAVAVGAFIVGVARFASATDRRGKGMAVAVAGLAGVGWLSWHLQFEGWGEAGRAFGPLLAGYAVYALWRWWRLAPHGGTEIHRIEVRLAVTLLALALAARMLLKTRIYQLGYYQAALTGVVLTAILLAELPVFFSDRRSGRALIVGGVAAALLPGIFILVRGNRDTYAKMTYPIGEGRDRFYTFPAKLFPPIEWLDTFVRMLRKLPAGQTVLVLPEGLMVNYLARVPSPLPPFFYYSVVTEHGREAELVKALQRKPPIAVVWVPHNLREYGIAAYGQRSGAGLELRQWMEQNYTIADAIGGRRIDYAEDSIALFIRKGVLK